LEANGWLIVRAVVTQVFPDEFHLHTLHEFLSATARLNPHVNVKAIVIGLMDRLSAYAARESEAETPEDKQKKEEEAVIQLFEDLRIAKEAKEAAQAAKAAKAAQQNGDSTETDHAESSKTLEDEEHATQDGTGEASTGTADDASIMTGTTAAGQTEEPSTETDGETKKSRGIPESIQLFEIFYEQVTSLVRIQRLPIQDTIGLLSSLANLAM
jgi:vacuolar protein sorting-associated protein 35